jgi:hypothetical protein
VGKKTMRLLLSGLAFCSVLAGCGGDLGLSQLFQTPCVAEACPVVDEEAGPNDARIELGGGTLLDLTANGQMSTQETRGGEIILSGSLYCVPSEGAPCSATLKRLRIELVPVEVDTNVGNFTLENLVVSYAAPLTIQDPGSGFVVPSGSTVHTCASVQGTSEHASATTTDDAWLSAWAYQESLSFQGTLPLVVKLGPDCTTVPMQVSGLFVGTTPWAQKPPP